MDDPDEENIGFNWVMVNPIDLAEEAITLDLKDSLDESRSKNYDNMESDIESDGISIISESSHLHDSEEEKLQNDELFNREVNVPEEETSRANNTTVIDSEQRTNWTFVQSKLEPVEMSSTNQFYLNCLQEPIQELSEDELGSVHSDTDSDGISIISECDVLHDFAIDKSLNNEFLAKDDCVNEQNELTTKFPFGIKKYYNGVLLGTILLATTSIFLGHYFSSIEPIEEDVPIYKEEYTNDVIENTPDNINDFKENMDVPTALTYCQQRHKLDDIFMEHNVKKCLRKIENRIKRKKDIISKKEEINKIEKYLKIKEQYLDEKEKFLVKREYELLKSELKLKHENTRRLRNGIKETLQDGGKNSDGILTESKKNRGTEESEINTSKIYKIYDRYKQLKKEETKYRTKDDGFKNKHKKKKGNKKDVHTAYKNKAKHSKEEKHNYNFNNDQKQKKNLNNKYKDEKHKGYIYTRQLKNEANDNHFQFRSQENKHDKQSENKIRGSTNYIILENNYNQTVSGYWVGKMYKARNDMRNKRHSGDWYFDRASYRKTKRDKAKWYFDWMMDRELLRYKRSVGI